MAKLRVMSYLDVGAPQYTADQRDAILHLMKMLNQTAYNTKFPTSLTVDSNTKTLHLSFAVAHGFTEGHLLEITGTTSATFQSDSYRVITVPSGTTLICKIDNYATVTYPSSDTSTQISVKHKPLGWDIVYSSATQYSIRSKSAISSKNVLTLKEPTLARLKFGVGAYSAPACVAAHISESVDGSTGEILNSYIKGNDYQNVESFYWASYNYSWPSSSYTPSASAISNGDHLLPWWLVGDDKIFYLILGAWHNDSSCRNRNASRVISQSTYRQCYMFGDPDFLGDPAFIDKGGCMFSAHYKPGGQHSPGPTPEDAPAVFTESYRTDVLPSNFAYGTYFVRPLDMVGNSVIPASWTTIDIAYTSTYYNFSTGAFYMQYPHVTTRGLLFFPYYARVHTLSASNSANYLRSILPYARMCPINLTNISQSWVGFDNVLIKSDNGKQILSIVRFGSVNTVYGSFLYELD